MAMLLRQILYLFLYHTNYYLALQSRVDVAGKKLQHLPRIIGAREMASLRQQMQRGRARMEQLHQREIEDLANENPETTNRRSNRAFIDPTGPMTGITERIRTLNLSQRISDQIRGQYYSIETSVDLNDNVLSFRERVHEGPEDHHLLNIIAGDSDFISVKMLSQTIDQWHNDLLCLENDFQFQRKFIKKIFEDFGPLGLVMASRIKDTGILDSAFSFQIDTQKFIASLTYYFYHHFVIPAKTNHESEKYWACPVKDSKEQQSEETLQMLLNQQVLRGLPTVKELQLQLKKTVKFKKQLGVKEVFLYKVVLDTISINYMQSIPPDIKSYERFYLKTIRYVLQKIDCHAEFLIFMNQVLDDIKKSRTLCKDSDRLYQFFSGFVLLDKYDTYIRIEKDRNQLINATNGLTKNDFLL